MDIFLICGGILLIVGIAYALTCINSPKMTFWEVVGITNRWVYLEEIPPIFAFREESREI